MKINLLLGMLAIAVLAAAAYVFINFDELLLSYYLTQDYPGFLQPVSAEVIDRRIDSFMKQELDEEDLCVMWKLLWMKKEFYKDSYMANWLRAGFVKSVSQAKVGSLQGIYCQLNLLKYKLGVNDVLELENFYEEGVTTVKENVCKKIEVIKKEVNWDDSCSVSHFVEAKFFCKLQLDQQDNQAAEKVISQNLGNCVLHCQEHCFADVPVYVNNCSRAKNDNERYHCLFFFDSG